MTGPFTVSEGRFLDPALARLLEGRQGDEPLTWKSLTERYQPGNPVDRLGACFIVLDHFRIEP